MSESAYEVIKIEEGAWRIDENGVRSFLFTGTDKALLVDSGFGTGDMLATVSALSELPVTLVNTHADRDHTGCNGQFSVAYMHPAEYDRYSQSSPGEISVSPLWEGDMIDLGERIFEVILIPGHTPGSIALLDRANRVLISGDSVQAGMIFMFGPGRNIWAYIDSMEKLYGIRDQFDTVYPSHGPFPIDVGALPGLIDGAKKLRGGELEGSDPPFDIDGKLYKAEGAMFLY